MPKAPRGYPLNYAPLHLPWWSATRLLDTLTRNLGMVSPPLGQDPIFDESLSQIESIFYNTPRRFLEAFYDEDIRPQYGQYSVTTLEHRKEAVNVQHEFVYAEVLDTASGARAGVFFERGTDAALARIPASRTVSKGAFFPRNVAPQTPDSRPDGVHSHIARDMVVVTAAGQPPFAYPGGSKMTFSVSSKLQFKPGALTILELGHLLFAINLHRPNYVVDETQCYWLAQTFMTAVYTIHRDAIANAETPPSPNFKAGKCFCFPVHLGNVMTPEELKERLQQVQDSFNNRDLLSLERQAQINDTQAQLTLTRDAMQAQGNELSSTRDAMQAQANELSSTRDAMQAQANELAATQAQLRGLSLTQEELYSTRDELAATRDVMQAQSNELAATQAQLRELAETVRTLQAAQGHEMTVPA